MGTIESDAKTGVQDEELFWEAVVQRDSRFEGILFYAVETTGIFCRPTCTSRRPNRKNVRFFGEAPAALAAGFRPCKRCKPNQSRSENNDLQWLIELCRFIASHVDRPPSLKVLAERAGYSPGHLQRTFRKCLGVSPRQYANALRLERFKASARAGASITQAIHQAGYGSSSRFYESNVRGLGMSPREYQVQGRSLCIEWTIRSTPLGQLLVAGTQKGLCTVRLGDKQALLALEFRAEFDQATLKRRVQWIGPWVHALVEYLHGRKNWPLLPLDITGTAFQASVWEALREIPSGKTASYAEIAAAIGRPKASRAVGSACAKNPVALAVPCHRVLPQAGGEGNYRWGKERKTELLEIEMEEGEDPKSRR